MKNLAASKGCGFMTDSLTKATISLCKMRINGTSNEVTMYSRLDLNLYQKQIYEF
jgi:hypothetical protein